MDGSAPLSTNPAGEIIGAVAPVLRRLRGEVDERVAAIEEEFGARMAAATQRMRELIEESRRRAEDAITASAEAVRMLAGQVAAEQQALPDHMRLALDPTRAYAERTIRVAADQARGLVAEATAETRARAKNAISASADQALSLVAETRARAADAITASAENARSLVEQTTAETRARADNAIGASANEVHTLVTETIAETRARAAEAIGASAAEVRQLAAAVAAESRSLPERIAALVALIPAPKDGRDGYISTVHEHIEGYLYEPGECCTAKGGLWQAIERTNAVPAADDRHRRLLADGLETIGGARTRPTRAFSASRSRPPAAANTPPLSALRCHCIVATTSATPPMRAAIWWRWTGSRPEPLYARRTP